MSVYMSDDFNAKINVHDIKLQWIGEKYVHFLQIRIPDLQENIQWLLFVKNQRRNLTQRWCSQSRTICVLHVKIIIIVTIYCASCAKKAIGLVLKTFHARAHCRYLMLAMRTPSRRPRKVDHRARRRLQATFLEAFLIIFLGKIIKGHPMTTPHSCTRYSQQETTGRLAIALVRQDWE